MVIFLLPAGCHGNLTVLNLLSMSLAKNQHFRPCKKNYALDRKSNYYPSLNLRTVTVFIPLLLCLVFLTAA